MYKIIFIFLTVIFLSSSNRVFSNVAFYYYGVENGLPETQINIIAQDSSGFIWLASENALFRFDGNRFKNYLKRENDGLLKGKINDLYVDSKGVLRVGTEWGFLEFNSQLDEFTAPDGWERVHILEMSEDFQHRIWIGTDEGLACYYPGENKTVWFTGTDTIKTIENAVLPFSAINHLTCRPDGKIWISGQNSGLFLFDPAIPGIVKSNTDFSVFFQKSTILKMKMVNNSLVVGTLISGLYIYDEERGKLVNKNFDTYGNTIHSFNLYEDSVLLVATNNGLIRYNFNTDKYQIYTNVPLDPLTLTRTAIVYVFADKDNNIWVSNGIKGINYGLNNVPFNHFGVSVGTDVISITQKEVTSMLFDKTGNFWIGYEAGFVEMMKNNNSARKVIPIAKNPNQLTGSILTLFSDSKNRIWMGGWHTGLQKLNKQGSSFEFVQVVQDSLKEIIEGADIRGITEDANGKIWFSIHGSGVGCYDPVTAMFDLYKHNNANPAASVSNDYTYGLSADKNNIWVATAYGVTKINATDNTFQSYFHQDGNPNSLSNNSITSVYCSVDNLVWVGTNTGLNVYLPGGDYFKPVLTDSEIPYLSINSIISVKPGELWISSNSGIIKLSYSFSNDAVNNISYNIFNRSHGVLSSAFFNQSVVKRNDGWIYFGGNESIDFFDPENAAKWENPDVKPIITDILVDGVRAVVNTAKNNEQNPIISLKFDDRVINIHFSTLQFNGKQSGNVRYKLENFNTDWVYPQNEQVATFTNLKQGKYSFMLEVKDNSGNWKNLDTPLSLVIKPPFWRTVPFFILVIIVTLSVIYVIHYFQTKRYLDRQKELETEIEKRTIELVKKNEELEIANQSKNKFFSIVSHDLRSPFSGLIGLIELINDPTNGLNEEKKIELLKLTEISAKNTFDFLETLLTWARSQMNQTACNPELNNLSMLIARNVELKKQTAANKGIKIVKHLPEKLDAFFDTEMINTVVRNILSNAIKFTKPGGKVEVSLTGWHGEAEIIIADTGIGMSGDELLHMFDLGKSSRKGTMGERGTGLGLIICKEFVEKNNGRIWATANEPQGTVFHFTLPLSKI